MSLASHAQTLMSGKDHESGASHQHPSHAATSDYAQPMSSANDDATSLSTCWYQSPPSSATCQPTDLEAFNDSFAANLGGNNVGAVSSDLLSAAAHTHPLFPYGDDGKINHLALVAAEGGIDLLYPLTPDPTASIYSSSPGSDLRAVASPSHRTDLPHSISPDMLQKPFEEVPTIPETAPPQLSPGFCHAGEGRQASVYEAALHQNQQVKASTWHPDGLMEAPGAHDSVASHSSKRRATSLTRGTRESASQNEPGRWQHAGLVPSSCTADTCPSVNEMSKTRDLEENKERVEHWLGMETNDDSSEATAADNGEVLDQPTQGEEDGIPLGDATENQPKPGRPYIQEKGGSMSELDKMTILRSTWVDAPAISGIQACPSGQGCQPPTSLAASQQFLDMCETTESLSRHATWGTQPPADGEKLLNGSLFKWLSIDGHGRKSHKHGGFRRKAFQQTNHKKRLADGGSGVSPSPDQSQGEAESSTQSRSPSDALSGRPRSVSYLGNTLASMGYSAASITRSHARDGPICASTPSSTQKSSSGGLFVRQQLKRRPRSKSDTVKTPPQAAAASHVTTPHHHNYHHHLANIFRKGTHRPVPPALPSLELNEEDEDDGIVAADTEVGACVRDVIKPDFSGFQQHVIGLNPRLAEHHWYLVNRISHQQVMRYEQLQTMRWDHQRVGAQCRCGTLCVALGGRAITQSGSPQVRPWHGPLDRIGDEDEPKTTRETMVQQDGFPENIPMPPCQELPAEFECQLCYRRKRLQNPSDWTKHVHEDVQPFTCTWENCDDGKMFKRKADWVRHENECHRHLEWWACDIEDCNHMCYRRDNFLQHLMRSHGFLERRESTKNDRTWAMVEKCHQVTPETPQREPCRFCGRTLSTWKRLQVHLAKHMEQIAFSVIRLVEANAQLDGDATIRPTQGSVGRDSDQTLPGEETRCYAPVSTGTERVHSLPASSPASEPEALGGLHTGGMSQQQADPQPYGCAMEKAQQPEGGAFPVGVMYMKEADALDRLCAKTSFEQHLMALASGADGRAGTANGMPLVQQPDVLGCPSYFTELTDPQQGAVPTEVFAECDMALVTGIDDTGIFNGSSSFANPPYTRVEEGRGWWVAPGERPL